MPVAQTASASGVLRRGRSASEVARPEEEGATREASVASLEKSVAFQLEALGWGSYQLMLLCAVGGAILSDSLELAALEPVNRAVDLHFGLSLASRAALPA